MALNACVAPALMRNIDALTVSRYCAIPRSFPRPFCRSTLEHWAGGSRSGTDRLPAGETQKTVDVGKGLIPCTIVALLFFIHLSIPVCLTASSRRHCLMLDALMRNKSLLRLSSFPNSTQLNPTLYQASTWLNNMSSPFLERA